MKWTLIIWNDNKEEHVRYDNVRFFESSGDHIEVILEHEASVEFGSIYIEDGQSLQILKGNYLQERV